MLKIKTARNCLILMLLALPTVGMADDENKPSLTVTDTYKIGGKGGWGYLTVDPETHLIYIPRGSHLQVIDPDVGEVAGDLLNCGANGVALVEEQKKGFTSNGNANTITAFDLETRKILYTVHAGLNPDAIIYDPFSKKVFAFDDISCDVTVIDPAATSILAVAGHIPIDGKPSFAVSDGNRHVYVNIEDKNEIQDIDSTSMTVVNTWRIDGEHPRGLAMDVEHHRLLVGCQGKLVIVDTAGKSVGSVSIGHDLDACVFDPVSGKVLASSGDGTLTTIKEISPGHFETLQTLQTKPSTRMIALDPGTHALYLPFAELQPSSTSHELPAFKPESFSILVIAPEK